MALACFVAVACDGDGDGASTGTPTAGAPSPVATPTPNDNEVRALRFLEPAVLPDNLAIIVETGCWQCDGPATGYVRIRRLPDGTLEERTLIDPDAYGGMLNGAVFDAQPGLVYVAVCERGCGGEPDARTTLYESRDGGVTVAPLASFDAWRYLVGYSSAGALMIAPVPDAESPVPLFDARGMAIAGPADGIHPHPLPNEILWVSDGRSTLRAGDNTVLSTSVGDQIADVTPLDSEGEVLAVSIYRNDAPPGYRLSIRRRAPNQLMHVRTFDGFIRVGPALDDCRFFGNTDLPAGAIPTPDTGGGAFTGFVPVIVDWCDGTAQPIVEPFTRAPYLNGRNFIMAVQRGPFVGVPDDIGDCLNVRADASTGAMVLGCFTAGVLLRDMQESRNVDGQVWRRVATPSGAEGWAAAAFLAP